MAKKALKLLMAASLLTLLAFQRQAVEDPSRFTWHNWSRQIGKSFAAALRATLRAIGIGPGLAPREPRNQLLLSASQRQSEELIAKVKMFLKALQIGFQDLAIDDEFEGIKFKRLEVRLPSGVKIVALPANPDTVRGETGDVTLDEMAILKKNRALYSAVYAMIMRGRGCLDAWSTPQGKQEKFYALADNKRFSHSTVTIEDAIAQGLDVDIEELKEGLDDPDAWDQEFMCKFVDDATALLTYEMITACEEYNLWAPLRTPEEIDRFLDQFVADGECFVGYDCGRRRDFPVLVLGEKLGSIAWTRAVVELPKAGFPRQREVLYRFLQIPGVVGASLDHSGLGMQLAEEAQLQFGMSIVHLVDFTNQAKAVLATRGYQKFSDGLVRIPHDTILRNDLHAIKKSRTAAGHIVFDAARTEQGHSDRFWALMLMLDAAAEGTGCVAPDLRVAERGELAAAGGFRGANL